MTAKAAFALAVLATGLLAQPVVYRADEKPDRTAQDREAFLTLRYGPGLEVPQSPEVRVGGLAAGFDRIDQNRIQVTSATLSVHLTAAETKAIDRRAESGQKSFLYIPKLISSGKASTDQLVEIPAGKPKLTLDFIRVRFLQVQENYLPAPLDAFKADPALWTLVDNFGRDQTITRIVAPSGIGERHLTFILAQLPRSGATLRLGVRSTPGGDSPVTVLGDIKTAAAPQATKDDPTGKADIYASFLLASSNGGDPVYGTDLRLKQNIRRAYWWGGYFGVTPAFTLKANSQTTDDENSLAAAANLEWLRPLENPVVVRSIYLVVAPTLEAKKNFANKNTVLDLSAMAVGKTLGSKNFVVGPRAYGGVEAGKNIDNVLPQLEGKRVTRWKAGGELKTRLDVNRTWLKDIGLDLSFVHRYLLEPELFTNTAKTKLPAGTLTSRSGETVQVPGGTLSRTTVFGVSPGTRNYFEARLRFGITSNIEAFTSYNLGSLPPLYEKVDKVQAGLAYRLSAPFH